MLVVEYLVVGLIVLACVAYWGQRLAPRTALAARTRLGLAGKAAPERPGAHPAARPAACGGCRNCDGGGCH